MKAAAPIVSHIRSQLGLFVLVVILLSVAFANFSNTWLTGWDTLHPEFDYSLNISRLLNGVWREDQGVGAVAAHSHMSDLPRVLVLALLDVVLPTHSVKLVYDLACFVLGPVGIYAFGYWQVFRKQKSHIRSASSFVSALVFALNLGTVQHFYIVFEMFAVQFAALGWLFLAASRYLETEHRRWLQLFAIGSLLATPMAYASTLWFAYAGSLALYLITLSLLNWRTLPWSRLGFILVTLIGTNAFWLLPNAYFLFSGAAHIPQQSQINQLFSPEAFLHNKSYGTIPDLALLKNFLFSWLSYDASTDQFTPLLRPWIEHLQRTIVMAVGYSVAALALAGACIAFFKRQKTAVALLPLFGLAVFMLINENPPFTAIFEWLRAQNSFFEEGLRFPFTKFSLIYLLSFSVLVGSAVSALERLNYRLITPLIAGCMLVALCWYSLPMFSGQLIAPKLRANIPTAYFDFFEYAQQLPKQTRIAQFPLNTLHGWNYHSWGYEGPGFVWFGINQPLLVRDFDRWSVGNETFYKQAQAALIADNPEQLLKVLDQYNVSYVLIDNSIRNPGEGKSLPHSSSALSTLKSAGAKIVWERDFLQLVATSKAADSAGSFISLPEKVLLTSNNSKYTQYDAVAQTYGNYIEPEENFVTRQFPFAEMTAQQIDAKFFRAEGNTIIMTKPINEKPGVLVLPAISEQSAFAPLTTILYTNQQLTITVHSPISIRVVDADGMYSQVPAFPEVTIGPLPLSIAPAELGIAVGNQVFSVTAETPFVTQLSGLEFNAPLTFSYFDQNEVQTDLGRTAVEKSAVHEVTTENFWQPFLQAVHIPYIASAQSIEFILPARKTNALNQLALSHYSNCEPDERGSVLVQFPDQNGTPIKYIANDSGTLCHGTELVSVTTDQSHLVQIEHQNITGRQLKLYITNNRTNKTEQEQLLGSSSVHWYSLLAQPAKPSKSRTLNLENKSFSKISSSNQVDKLDVFSLPVSLQYLAAVELTPNAETMVSNAWDEARVQRLSSTKYAVAVSASNSTQSNTGIVALYQGYDTGWEATFIPDSHSYMIPITKVFPMFFGKRLPHSQFNGWANSWMHSGDAGTVVIWYWPQTLEIVGIIILFATGVFLIFKRNRKHQKLVNTD